MSNRYTDQLQKFRYFFWMLGCSILVDKVSADIIQMSISFIKWCKCWPLNEHSLPFLYLTPQKSKIKKRTKTRKINKERKKRKEQNKTKHWTRRKQRLLLCKLVKQKYRESNEIRIKQQDNKRKCKNKYFLKK